MQVVGVGDGGVIGGPDGDRHRLGRANVHGPHPIPDPVDVGVRVAGGQLRKDDVGIRRHLVALAYGDHGVLVVG